MSGFNVGDKVEILAGAIGVGFRFGLGSIGTVCGFDERGLPEIEQDEMRYVYHPHALRLVPAFGVGDRVRAPGGGETTITATFTASSWEGGEEPREVYGLANGSLHTDKELQHAPEPVRVPKAGEVWGFSDQPMYCLGSGQVCYLVTGRMLLVEDEFKWLGRHGIFLAPSLLSYFRDHPL